MKKYLSYAIFGIAVFALTAAGFASAYRGDGGGHRWGFGGKTDFDREAYRTEVFDQKSELLGISSEDLETRLEAGETFLEIAESQGVTEEELMAQKKALMTEKLAEKLSKAVADGDLTQEEADEKLAKKLERIESGEYKGKMHHKGFGKHGFFHKDK